MADTGSSPSRSAINYLLLQNTAVENIGVGRPLDGALTANLNELQLRCRFMPLALALAND